jgi:hypothetical protein
MKVRFRKTAQLGEVVAAAFDGAERYSTDPREVSRLATQAVAHLLHHARRLGRISMYAPIDVGA